MASPPPLPPPPPPPLRRQFLHGMDLTSLPTKQRGFAQSMRQMERDLGGRANVTPDLVRTMVAEEFPPETLFSTEIAALPAGYRALRDWLTERGVNMGGNRRRIPYQLAEKLYDDDEDRESARELVKGLLSAERRRGAPGGAAAPNPNEPVVRVEEVERGQSSHARKAHNVAMRYRDESKKYTGAEDQALHEHIAGYQDVCTDYELTHEEQLTFLHHMFGGEAKRYYDQHVNGFAATAADASETAKAHRG
eukprot:TRINITY_DN7756_c0_g2_i1.p1 TRINITY_DN7756_c0_g2~~TRINITY_DN7756_c0_g2_i1.p1  ORF type:complete len:250 (+),score=58.51 TRINITY_DN7756_c0_g2_i1:173-922(+)